MRFQPSDLRIRVSGDYLIVYTADDSTNEVVVQNARNSVSLQEILDDAERYL